MKPIWTSEQVEFLKANYANMKTDQMLATLTDKTNDQLRWKAKQFGLNKRVTRSRNDMTWLERFDDPETCYWWGFITADGCINARQLILAVHERDEEHLKRFCAKTGSRISRSTKSNEWNPDGYTMVRTAVEDKWTLPRLKEILKIVPQKTYNPLDVTPFCQSNRLAYFMAGLIDGDGNIYVDRENSAVDIRIKVHPAWKSSFTILSQNMKELYGIESTVSFVKGGWVVLRIQKMRHISRLYDLVQNKVPFMERKWSKIDWLKNHCESSTDNRLGKIGVNPSAHLR